MAPFDPYLDPELYDGEQPCRHCGRHQGECGGPTFLCCKHCDHWTPLPLTGEAA